MKKIFFIGLAVVAFAATAFAQECVYPTDNVTINFKRKPAGVMETGQFSVSGSVKVNFSSGNLQYTILTGKWKIMSHQYDMVETSDQEVGDNYENQDVVTLFGWGTAGVAAATGAYQPYSTTLTKTEYVKYLSSSGGWTASKSDWGVCNSTDLGDGWRILTQSEWAYLLNTRATGKTINDTNHARYAEATINTDGTSVNGVIIFPDNYTGPTSNTSEITWGAINKASAWGTQCTIAGWADLEAAGCVFLPAAGYRAGTTVRNVGTFGSYWYTTASSSENAYTLQFQSNVFNINNDMTWRSHGRSVRLVKEVVPE